MRISDWSSDVCSSDLDTVRAAKKPVLAFATAYTTDSYQIASHASEIWAAPIGGVALAGPGGSHLYYKGLMDRLGVTAHTYRVGTFKSQTEPFLRAAPSPQPHATSRRSQRPRRGEEVVRAT